MNKKQIKIEKISIVDQVYSAIKNDIAEGIYKVGERLPSETEFATAYGVNRLSVRMALQKLSAVGIIETRVGEGSFVKEFSIKSFIDEISIFLETDKKLKEVQQLRNLIEVESTRLAAAHATDEEKKLLHELLQDYLEAKKEQEEHIEDENLQAAVAEADLNFHMQIVRMSHNRLYLEIYYIVKKLIKEHISNLIAKRSRQIKEKTIIEPKDSHILVYEGIISGDLSISEKAYHQMIDVEPWEL